MKFKERKKAIKAREVASPPEQGPAEEYLEKFDPRRDITSQQWEALHNYWDRNRSDKWEYPILAAPAVLLMPEQREFIVLDVEWEQDIKPRERDIDEGKDHSLLCMSSLLAAMYPERRGELQLTNEQRRRALEAYTPHAKNYLDSYIAKFALYLDPSLREEIGTDTMKQTYLEAVREARSGSDIELAFQAMSTMRLYFPDEPKLWTPTEDEWEQMREHMKKWTTHPNARFTECAYHATVLAANGIEIKDGRLDVKRKPALGRTQPLPARSSLAS